MRLAFAFSFASSSLAEALFGQFQYLFFRPTIVAKSYVLSPCFFDHQAFKLPTRATAPPQK